jgi:rhodanese-related sulfurtransferase
MRTRIFLSFFTFVVLAFPQVVLAEPVALENYLLSFDYDARRDMKTNSIQLIDLLLDEKAVLVDIRFPEEHQAWGVSFSLNIPLNELPNRLDELPKDKIIITACPLKDRAILAMAYLRTQGFQSRYLTDGLLGLIDNLRGDNARYLMEFLPVEEPAATEQ